LVQQALFPDGSWESERVCQGIGRGSCVVVAGIDEAGRGALAGPVSSACVIFNPPVTHYKHLGINDSKMLSPRKREKLYSSILENAKLVSVGWASVQEINFLNIRSATLLAMRRAVEGVIKNLPHDSLPLLAIDGQDLIPGIPLSQEAVVGGDRMVLSIAAASIVAKVSRDRLMEEIDREYPVYRFREHKGYGTLVHRESIRAFGLTPYHRLLFCRKLRD